MYAARVIGGVPLPPVPPPVFGPAPDLRLPPPPRPPIPSYQVIEDNPTEVDGPPTMTIDGSFMIGGAPLPEPVSREPPDSSGKRRTGRR